MNAITNIVTTGLLAATMLGVGTAGTAVAASEEQAQQKLDQHNYQIVHEINTEDIYRINGEPCTYEEWIAYLEWIQSLPDSEVIVIDPEPTQDVQPQIEASKILYADSDEFAQTVTTEGTEIPYLAVYNGGSKMAEILRLENIPYVVGSRSNNFPELTKLNLDFRCINRSTSTPFEFDGAGVYILTNVRIEEVTTEPGQNSNIPVYKITLTCTQAYRPADILIGGE